MSPNAGPIRSFIAIELGDPARSAVRDYLAALQTGVLGVAWTRPTNLHVTLKFLGAVAPSRLETLAERLRTIARAQPPFMLTVAGVGAFPSVAHPRVLWVRVAADVLAGLAADVDRACAAEGFAPEARPFHPHVTLGRVRQPMGSRAGGRRRRGSSEGGDGHAIAACLAKDGERAFGTSVAEALVLFRSELHPGGARYTPLQVLRFAGRGDD